MKHAVGGNHIGNVTAGQTDTVEQAVRGTVRGQFAVQKTDLLGGLGGGIVEKGQMVADELVGHHIVKLHGSLKIRVLQSIGLVQRIQISLGIIGAVLRGPHRHLLRGVQEIGIGLLAAAVRLGTHHRSPLQYLREGGQFRIGGDVLPNRIGTGRGAGLHLEMVVGTGGKGQQQRGAKKPSPQELIIYTVHGLI
ncbi:hypothetical protein [Paramuribaculum intestinale]|uniref:hypothetical protein n=1 Tax=Paramuribaculum intestinale TaxID=2094151 RepID=UPI00272B3557|nr:hypothetical protein [Paramuribaculum intestinale]